MKYIIPFVAALWVVAVFLSACKNDPSAGYKVQVKCLTHGKVSKEHRDWIAQCIKDANPRSDEEPEDMIIQCERTAINLFCVNTWYVADTSDWDWTPCKVALDTAQQACKSKGWEPELDEPIVSSAAPAPAPTPSVSASASASP